MLRDYSGEGRAGFSSGFPSTTAAPSLSGTGGDRTRGTLVRVSRDLAAHSAESCPRSGMNVEFVERHYMLVTDVPVVIRHWVAGLCGRGAGTPQHPRGW